jgi:hypothetical protein
MKTQAEIVVIGGGNLWSAGCLSSCKEWAQGCGDY